MKKFYSFRQNNSGGSFHGPAVNVLIEASSLEEACSRTEPHFTLCGGSGLYAEYDNCGCCPCCGHRWTAPWSDEPEEFSSMESWIKERGLEYMGKTATALVKEDGSLILGDSIDNLLQILEYIRPTSPLERE